MAIHTSEGTPAPAPAATAQPAQPIDIAAWTEQATAAMSSMTISAGETTAQGTTVTLAIPLDDVAPAAARPTNAATAAKEGGYYKRKEPLRRDSLKRREALLKGKEGSRRRMRWENDRLLHNPHAEPPSPRDWEVHPTHTVRHVPYYLAPLWDAGLARQQTERKSAASKAAAKSKTVANKPAAPGIVPKELREKLKRSRGAKGLLKDLEISVREFVSDVDAQARKAEREGLPMEEELDSSDDEIVFVGRNGKTREANRMDASFEQVKRELMLFETPEGDQGGSFGRWLVHHLGVYYGLRTWSVTRGDPARREAYVGVKEGNAMTMKSGHKAGFGAMPRPLWGLV